VSAGTKKHLIDVAIGASGEPANIFGDQGAEAIHATNHGTGFYGHELKRSLIDGGRSGTKAKNAKGDGHANSQNGYRENDAQENRPGQETTHDTSKDY